MHRFLKASSQYDAGLTERTYRNSFVNVIMSYCSDPIGASGASAGVDSTSPPAEPA